MSRSKISTVVITKNVASVLEDCLKSVDWTDEIIVVDNHSRDGTIDIANKYADKVYLLEENNLGIKKNFAVNKATSKWILILDADERVSKKLRKEIEDKILNSQSVIFNGFQIKFLNHFLGKPIFFGGENYSKIRLFQKGKGNITSVPIHEEVIVKGKVGYLENCIFHYSYRSLTQIVKKFHKYARVIAEEKYNAQERTHPAKLFSYPIHMFYARFFKDRGYRDGWRGLILALLFSFMEFLIYFNLLLLRIREP